MDLLIYDGVSITLDSGALLIIINSHLHACNNMWYGIIVSEGATLGVIGSLIEDAQYALQAHSGARLMATNTTFRKNYVGVHVPPAISGASSLSLGIISNCTFTCEGVTLLPKFAGQTPEPYTKTFAGIYINDLTLLTLPGGTNKNTFAHLNHGIYSVNSHLTVGGGVFKHIRFYDPLSSGIPVLILTSGSSNLIPFSYQGAGIFAAGNGHGFTFKGNGKTSPDYNFDNCHYGILADGMKTEVSSAVMTNVLYTGIRIQNNTNRMTKILSNAIATPSDSAAITGRQTGIELAFNAGADYTLVENNLITMQNRFSSLSAGVKVSGNPVSSSRGAIINNNDIYMANAASSFGVHLLSAKGYTVQYNRIKFSNALPLPGYAAGIHVGNSPRTSLLCNDINGRANGNWNQSGRYAVYTLGSNDYYYKCNTIDSTYEGFYFTGTNWLTDSLLERMESNNIRRHTNGLHIAKSGVVGEQSFSGNLWFMQNYNLGNGAWHEDTTHAKQGRDQFTVASNSGWNGKRTNLPSPILPSLGWFNPDVGTDAKCVIPGGFLFPYCQTPVPVGTIGGITGSTMSGKVSMYERLAAQDSVHSTDYDEQTVWNVRRTLMEKLLMDTALVSQDTIITNFYTTFKDDNIGLLSKIRLAMDTLHNIDSTTMSIILYNDRIIDSCAVLIAYNDSLLANSTVMSAAVSSGSGGGGSSPGINVDSVLTQTYSCMEAIRFASAANDSIYNTIRLSINLKAASLTSANMTLSSSYIYEQNEIDVNNIYLSAIAIGRSDSLISYSTQLYNMARQCALNGGPAVSYARSLYYLLNDSVLFDDNQICGSPNDTCLVPATPGIITGKTSGVCSQQLSYEIDSMPDVTGYTWSLTGNAVIDSGQGSAKMWVSFTDTFVTGTINIYASNSCGNSNMRTLAVSGYPSSPVISGASGLCANATGITFTIDSVDDATGYTWAVPPGCTLVSGQGTTSIVVDWDTLPGDVIAVASNDCGASDSTYHTVGIVACRIAASQPVKVQSSVGNVRMYPNPTTGNVTVVYQLNNNSGTLQFIDMMGRMVSAYPLDGNKNRFEFNIADLCCGILQYRVIDYETVAGQGKLVIIK